MLDTITLSLYTLGGIAQALASQHQSHFKANLLYGFGIPAIILHGFLLYSWIALNSGQNLTEFNLLSLAGFVTSIIILLITLHKPITYLSIFVFPLTAASIFLASQFPSHHIIQTVNDPKQFMHILLSVITFSVLSIAGLQAFTLALQEKFIRHKNFVFSSSLPPIESMERLLFQMIGIGSILLSFILGTSIYFFHAVLINQFLEKTILTFITWFVFTLLSVGRYYFGWRGKKAIYCTLSGVALLTVIYSSSLIILEFMP